jgi:predicted alpha/beta-hydrolase family hydrolase
MIGKSVAIKIPGGDAVSGLWNKAKDARAVLVLAHGAGAGMTHRHMEATADGLAERGIAVLRFNFPYMDKGGKRPDAPPVAEAAVRAAVAEANRLAKGLPLFAGGRSFGGRMTSGAQAKEPLPDVAGLVFFAFPLHLAGKPATERARHLGDIKIPMLFLSGSRDPLAELDLLKPTVKKLGARAKLILAADADHSFHVPARTGRKDPEVFAELLDAARDWMLKVAKR